MDLVQFAPFFLFLHVMGAILAFGPTFAYSIMGSMAGKEPQHANFSARQVDAIGNRLVYPLAIFQGITGILLLIALQINDAHGIAVNALMAAGLALFVTTLLVNMVAAVIVGRSRSGRGGEI